VGLDTPALVIDLDIVDANAQRMAEATAARGVALRPHVKTHKSVALAQTQIEAGAVGITVGTLGEAEVMAAGGIRDIFLAYPLWLDAAKAPRLRTLCERDGLTFSIGADSIAGVEQLASACVGLARRPRVLIEIDPGYHRTGLAPDMAGDVAKHASRLGFDVVGVFAHGGHAYFGRESVGAAAVDEVEALTIAEESLHAAGIQARTVSAGSTPTALAAASGPVTEVRPGTYLINDRIQVHLGSCSPDAVAICVAATVVSDAAPGKYVINAGAKTLTKDSPPYLAGHGILPDRGGAIVERVSDYHGEVAEVEGVESPRVGDVVAVIPNHVCPVIDLFDSFIATRSGEFVGVWPVDARGRSG
jgi:D-serine deaminase-like pyridoxal phosphate-dependent protein